MIRETLGHDAEKVMYRLLLRPREIAAAVKATGLSEDAFAGTWDTWFFPAFPSHWVLVEHRPSRHSQALDWVQRFLDGLPDWGASVLVGEEQYVDEFWSAGHLAQRDAHGRVEREWRDHRGEHAGLVCAKCGYRQCMTCDGLDDVPDCDGALGKVRRLNERWRDSMAETDRLGLDLWQAELAAESAGLTAKARSHRYDFYYPPEAGKDIPRLAEMEREGSVLGYAMVVLTRNGLNLRHHGELDGVAQALRRLSAEVEDAPRKERIAWLEKRIWEAMGVLLDRRVDPKDAARLEMWLAELKPLVSAEHFAWVQDPMGDRKDKP